MYILTNLFSEICALVFSQNNSKLLNLNSVFGSSKNSSFKKKIFKNVQQQSHRRINFS